MDEVDQGNRLRTESRIVVEDETDLPAEEMKQVELKCCVWVQEEVSKEEYEQLKAAKNTTQ